MADRAVPSSELGLPQGRLPRGWRETPTSATPPPHPPPPASSSHALVALDRGRRIRGSVWLTSLPSLPPPPSTSPCRLKLPASSSSEQKSLHGISSPSCFPSQSLPRAEGLNLCPGKVGPPLTSRKALLYLFAPRLPPSSFSVLPENNSVPVVLPHGPQDCMKRQLSLWSFIATTGLPFYRSQPLAPVFPPSPVPCVHMGWGLSCRSPGAVASWRPAPGCAGFGSQRRC